MRYASACPAALPRPVASTPGHRRPHHSGSRQGPAAAAYTTDTLVTESPVPASASASADQGLLVRAHLSAEQLYPGARQDLSLLVTNRGPLPVTTTSVRHLGTVVTNSAGECGAGDFSMTRVSAPSTLIPAGETRRLDLPGALAMKRSAGDGSRA